eukprot:TRINITY_DN434_c0_g1_i1.p1 TRINITY_DN434_c0_g1~~TRINITY_DN434_c0_g1_i1.p1  ORF type:complete len:890 (-),score=196.15 TRINITY_DN434_c0_g1_i1:81-2750(-)
MLSSQLVLTLLLASASLVHSHGYLRSPPSRNTIPGATVEPQSANTGGVCGTISSGSPNFNDARFVSNGGTFNAGQSFQAEVAITAHHMGHFEFRLCTNPSDLTQTCFDQHVLTRTANSGTPSPLDTRRPERWYLPPRTNGGNGNYLMEFKLPDGVSCEHCVLQWTYITANSCVSAGYKSFFTENDASGATNSGWHMGWMGSGDQGTCGGREASQYVGGMPEKFWSCADIKILPCDGCTSAPTPQLTAAPTSTVTTAPTSTGPAPPSSAPTSGPPPTGGSCAEAGCASCGAIPGNPQSASDAHCRPCASGQPWWPCNIDGLCQCATGATAAPTAAVTAAPTVAVTAAPTAAVTDSPTTAVTASPTAAVTASPTSAPTAEATAVPTTPPANDCGSGCASCVSVAGNCANATDVQCGPCAEGQFWWPCNLQGACKCQSPSLPPTDPPATQAPTAAVTAAPTVAVTAAPTVAVTTAPSAAPTTSGPPLAGGDSRLIAYLGNWQSCPTAAQTAKYTHIVVAFAVTYTWNPAKNVCNQQCAISTPPICNNAPQPALVAAWKAAGKKVILSFGGAGMGGSWSGDVNECWDYCLDKPASVVSQLTSIVNNQNLDGVDIDYEYFYEDSPANRPAWNKGAQAVSFLRQVTTGLRSALPAGSIVTHAPMDSDLQQGKAYYNVLKEVAGSMDFLMPQYYNGITRPASVGVGSVGTGTVSALSNYNMLVNDMFGGSAGSEHKVVFGLCIGACSGTGSNANAQQAARIMTDLKVSYPCNGGAFFWVVQDDMATQGAWSNAVSAVLQTTAGCSGTTPPRTSPPTSASTGAPATSAPTSASTAPPTATPGSSCASGCSDCGAVPGNFQSATDAHCAPCANGQSWWPCASAGLCTCLDNAVLPIGN